MIEASLDKQKMEEEDEPPVLGLLQRGYRNTRTRWQPQLFQQFVYAKYINNVRDFRCIAGLIDVDCRHFDRSCADLTMWTRRNQNAH